MTHPTDPRVEVTPSVLRELLDYNPETGKLHWRPRDSSFFSPGSAGGPGACAAGWNTRFAGKEAFTRKSVHGYAHGPVLGKTRTAHRVAWAIYYGEWPASNIDHINGERADNRIANLRLATVAENSRNLRLRRGNTSGCHGVRYNHSTSKWEARITCNYRQMHLGSFATKEEAIAVRREAEAAHGFSTNHGGSNE